MTRKIGTQSTVLLLFILGVVSCSPPDPKGLQSYSEAMSRGQEVFLTSIQGKNLKNPDDRVFVQEKQRVWVDERKKLKSEYFKLGAELRNYYVGQSKDSMVVQYPPEIFTASKLVLEKQRESQQKDAERYLMVLLTDPMDVGSKLYSELDGAELHAGNDRSKEFDILDEFDSAPLIVGVLCSNAQSQLIDLFNLRDGFEREDVVVERSRRPLLVDTFTEYRATPDLKEYVHGKPWMLEIIKYLEVQKPESLSFLDGLNGRVYLLAGFDDRTGRHVTLSELLQ